MHIFREIHATHQACREARSRLTGSGATGLVPLGLVPTMGALHAGHLSLVRRARQSCAVVAATIFVNPLQFAPGEDLERYPRSLEDDCTMLEAEGVDLVFIPSAEEMYPQGARTTVEVAGLSERLDGAHRQGHFRGVATVVAKLFHIIEPDNAYFGQKDAVQVAVLRQMVRDLNFFVEVITCETVRDADGLALSSRNAYLTAAERRQALAIPRALEVMQACVLGGKREVGAVLRSGLDVLQGEPAIALEFMEAVDATSLDPVDTIVPGNLIALAARVGKTRLIDNILTK